MAIKSGDFSHGLQWWNRTTIFRVILVIFSYRSQLTNS
jgi:hypothetical protein